MDLKVMSKRRWEGIKDHTCFHPNQTWKFVSIIFTSHTFPTAHIDIYLLSEGDIISLCNTLNGCRHQWVDGPKQVVVGNLKTEHQRKHFLCEIKHPICTKTCNYGNITCTDFDTLWNNWNNHKRTASFSFWCACSNELFSAGLRQLDTTGILGCEAMPITMVRRLYPIEPCTLI